MSDFRNHGLSSPDFIVDACLNDAAYPFNAHKRQTVVRKCVFGDAAWSPVSGFMQIGRAFWGVSSRVNAARFVRPIRVQKARK
jgi:hypothetical protein